MLRFAPVQTCPECGNHDMQVRVLDGATVHECGFCGARFGDAQAIAKLESRTEAATAGVDEHVWPLVQVLSRLPGLTVGDSSGGSVAKYSMPRVELLASGDGALVQIENLTKALRLMAGSLRCMWQITVHYDRALTFVLAATGSGASLRDARIDLEALARRVERDSRLTWWRHADGQPNK